VIVASVVLATVLAVGTPLHRSVAGTDTTLSAAPRNAAVVASDPKAQPGVFDPARFDSATTVALRHVFDSASALRLPIAPLINKANRGASFRASGRKIVTNVHAHFVDMLAARAALGENASESELDSGAEAIHQGVDGMALQQIRTERPARGAAVSALVVMTDLIQRGISTNKARDAIVSLARVSPTDEAINGLQVLVAKQAIRGPGMAQDALDRYVRSNVSGAQKNAPNPVTRPPSPPDAP